MFNMSDLQNTEHGFNAVNRGVYVSDNLPFLRSLNDECVDLVCIDPPFAKNETFGKRRETERDPLRPPLTDAEREIELRLLQSWGIRSQRDAEAAGIVWPETRYRDIWSWEADIHEDWLLELTKSREAIAGIINVARYTHGDDIAAYLCYMSIRLLEIHRVLKPTGSLYLHCDNNVNTCLGELLIAIFGADNFRSAIAWKRTSTHSDAKNYANVLDTIFYYTKSGEYVWNPQHGEHDREYVDDKYRYDDGDGRGRYTLDNMTSPNPRPNMMYEWQGHASPPKGWRYSRETMAQLDGEGRIWYPDSKDRRPRLKRYLSEMPGRIVDSNWSDIPPLNSQARERTGYPTQKPVALAERIIAASTNPGDVVLDCFAGCAYVGVAAERLDRQWVACDINPRAWTVFKRQFNKPNLALLRCHEETAGQQVLGSEPVATVHGPAQLPERESPVGEYQLRTFNLPELKFKVPSSLIPDAQMMMLLLELSDYTAWCCGFANRRPDGSVIRTTRNFHLDHVDPQSKDGSNQITNRAPLCPAHNTRKGNRRVHLDDYRREIADAGEMMVDSINDLISLPYAYQRALVLYAEAYAARAAV